ncbi:MAG TPA: histidine triad nucleotide-binding protein [Opitutales bacterium]|nr:histidine triad nucleotide-binding protein [Opitutales bacterium]
MPDKTIFQRIIEREIPSTSVYEDEICYAFRDINAQAPTHILIVPKKPIARLAEANPTDQSLLGHLLLTAARIARDLKLERGYRVVINNGPDGGESVPHLHVHLLAGRPLRWPPG